LGHSASRDQPSEGALRFAEWPEDRHRAPVLGHLEPFPTLDTTEVLAQVLPQLSHADPSLFHVAQGSTSPSLGTALRSRTPVCLTGGMLGSSDRVLRAELREGGTVRREGTDGFGDGEDPPLGEAFLDDRSVEQVISTVASPIASGVGEQVRGKDHQVGSFAYLDQTLDKH
jgi:hypothetical protein